jgi:penicillin-binding protein 2
MKPDKTRVWFFYAALMVGVLLFVARLFQLQIVLGKENRAVADGNRIKKEILPAPRGIIYDRVGRKLVNNVPLFRLVKREGGKTTELKTITREEATSLELEGKEEDLRIDVGREYLYGQSMAHVLGYLSEANEEEVANQRFQLGDLVGRLGLEKKYDAVLRGKDGGRIYEVDSLGNIVREVGIVEPTPGQDLKVSLDANLSRVAYEALGDRKGAVVVTEAKTGRVLALVSSPSFDSNIFEKWQRLRDPELGRAVEEVLGNENRPMFNRAIGGLYPPGSTFKMVTAVAGLEEGKVNKETTYVDTGEIRVGDYVYRNWYFTQYGRTEGEINIVQALRRSTDTFFYKVGEWVGPAKLGYWAKKFGLGSKAGIDIEGEVAGFVPDPEKEDWFLGNTYHLAIGQANLLTTPLQVNLMTAVVANDGKLCRPGIVERQELGYKDTESECKDLGINPETLRLVKEGMKEACSTGGTAFPFFDFKPQAACKTGTAEYGDPKGRTHAWFTAFAPVDDPEIVVTVLVEGGGEGSSVAAPIARKVMEEFFEE